MLKSTLPTIIGVLLGASILSNAATVATFTGGDTGEGIDFSGNVVYALNLAGAGNSGTAPDLLISGVTFKDVFGGSALIPNVDVGFSAIDNWVSKPTYGSTANDDNLEELMFDVAHGTPNMPTVVFSGLLANQLYRLQVLVSDNSLSASRGTSYQLITGNLSGTVADQSLNMNITSLQGGDRTKGVVVTLEGLSDASGQLSFRTPDGVGFTDPNGIANALILTQIPEPSIAMLGGLGVMALLRRRRSA